MRSHHPSPELLEKFAEASLDGALGSIVSAHVEQCSFCQQSVKILEEGSSLKAFENAPRLLPMQESQAWENISSRLGPIRDPDPAFSIQHEIQIDGLKFGLPRSLKKLAAKPLKWMQFGKGGKICKLGGEKENSLFLIYLASNEEVPLHSHAGAEHSYVISGSYSADGNTFETGDFTSSRDEVTHSPKAGSEDGCLLLSSVENRLNFLHGWLKPFNGLLWWALNLRI